MDNQNTSIVIEDHARDAAAKRWENLREYVQDEIARIANRKKDGGDFRAECRGVVMGGSIFDIERNVLGRRLTIDEHQEYIGHYMLIIETRGLMRWDTCAKHAIWKRSQRRQHVEQAALRVGLNIGYVELGALEIQATAQDIIHAVHRINRDTTSETKAEDL